MEYVDAALTHASAPQPQAVTVPGSPSKAPGNILASALETLAAGLPDSIGNWLGQATCDIQSPVSWPAPIAAHAETQSALGPESDAARLLALMRQDMSAFGSKVGDADLTWRKAETVRPVDFFAG